MFGFFNMLPIKSETPQPFGPVVGVDSTALDACIRATRRRAISCLKPPKDGKILFFDRG